MSFTNRKPALVEYSNLVALLSEGIKQLKAETDAVIAELREQIKELKGR